MTGSRAQRHLRALTRLRAGAGWRGTGMNALQVLRDARDTRAAVVEFVVERRALLVLVGRAWCGLQGAGCGACGSSAWKMASTWPPRIVMRRVSTLSPRSSK